MGLSLAAIGVAAAGYLPRVAGALFREVIVLAEILNALEPSAAEPEHGGDRELSCSSSRVRTEDA